jgi:SAM-dependent methyltransferase
VDMPDPERGVLVNDLNTASYDPFAWFYNRYWGADSLAFLPALETLLFNALAKGSRVLDLACGSGHLTRVLAERGFLMTGVDGSSELLRLFEENAPGVEAIQADLRCFKVSEGFDAAICIYDSLNHILDIESLESIFRRVFESLRSEGHFLFDLNGEEGYRGRWSGTFGIVEPDHAGIFRLGYEEQSRMARFDATLFQLDMTGWHRTDVSLAQRCHSEQEVRDALLRAGFAVEAVRQAHELGVPNQPGRIFVCARKLVPASMT